METPNEGDGEGEEDEIHEHVEYLVDDDQGVAVYALAVDALVPVGS